jgi:hypothetical protein
MLSRRRIVLLVRLTRDIFNHSLPSRKDERVV